MSALTIKDGVVMKEYVVVPDALLEDTPALKNPSISAMLTSVR